MATSPFDHLHPDIRHLATADRQLRKTCILTDRWISYPAGEDAIERLFELVDMPPRVRMPSILFWASPNMGKTHIQKRFLDLCAARDAKDQPTSFGAVLWLELNDSLTEKRLYLDVLTALGAPAPDTTTPRLQAMVLRHLAARRIRLIIFDELQRVTELRAKDQRAILNVLKYLGTGPLAALLEQPIFRRKSLQGSNYLQMDWWTDIDAATRLLYVRLALAILADPGDPVGNPKTSPLGPNWLTLRYRHAKIQGWQSVFTHAVPDLLFLLVTELPRHAVQELNERSMAWPADLRRRWTYAVAVGAVGGFVW